MTRALIVYSHPLTGSFTDATRNSVVSGLNSVGAEIRLADLYADGFDPCYSALDYANSRDGGIDRSLAGYVEDLAWCDTLIFVYPTWWAGQPSMLTGWINRVWEGAAASGSSGATGHGLRPRSNVKRVVAVTSHGSSKLINMVEGEAGKRTLTRCLRSACHWRARTTWLALYAIDASTLAQREAFLRKVERRISTLT